MNGTIVIDTSAFIAILLNEAGAAAMSGLIRRYPRRAMAAATYLECAIVGTKKTTGRADLDAWLLREAITVVPVDQAIARIAADAFVLYGKGRHPAGLNFGDCFAYALAKSLAAPLLFKGDDFPCTDVTQAIP